MKSPKKLAAALARRILSPLVPARKMLPFMCWLNGISADYDPYYERINLFYGSARTAVDIGANIGLYTYRFSKRFQHVYAFEMNSEITGWIKQYNPGNIELIQCGLSSQAGTARYYIPVAHGLNLAGYATLHRDILPQADGCVEKECRVAPLDEFAITAVDFMKIDVEGHELEVLKGAAKTIEQSRPVVLIEVQTMNERTVEAWFLALDYRQCRYLPTNQLVVLTEFLPSTGDCLYIPRERLTEFGLA
jgi:FkbM family methyltransferase